jgi:hypothetical protein
MVKSTQQNPLGLLADVLRHDDQVGVPFDQSWSLGTSAELRGACDTPGCVATPVVVVRVGNGAGCYCEACWHRDALVRFLADILWRSVPR